MLAASLFSANITEIVYPDKQDKNGTLKLILMFEGSFNASFEQKNEGGMAILTFYGLNNAESSAKALNTSMIQSVSVKPSDKNSTEILFVGRQLFDISVTNDANTLYIALTPKAAPFTIENIAKDTGSGTLGYILNMLFYIVIFLFIITVTALLFLKFKLFGRGKKVNTKTKELKQSSYKEAFKITKSHESFTASHEQNIEDAKQTENSTVPQSKQSAENPPKPKTKSKKKTPSVQQKTLFD
jgi:hypothetical protein